MSSAGFEPQTVPREGRIRGLDIERPIVYGNIAYWQGKRAQETETHRWVVYVRGVYNEDISYFVKKVVFTLHQSFNNPVRVVEKPPFQVAEVGWGEFLIRMKLYFVDPHERPVELQHVLHLFPPNQQQMSIRKPVVSEHYDEIVFRDVHESFWRKLMVGGKLHENPPPGTNEKEDYTAIREAHQRVREEIQRVRDQYAKLDIESHALKTQIERLSRELGQSGP